MDLRAIIFQQSAVPRRSFSLTMARELKHRKLFSAQWRVTSSTSNVARGGRYEKSREVDRVIADARASIATLLNAHDPSEVAFGINAISLIPMVSLAVW